MLGCQLGSDRDVIELATASDIYVTSKPYLNEESIKISNETFLNLVKEIYKSKVVNRLFYTEYRNEDFVDYLKDKFLGKYTFGRTYLCDNNIICFQNEDNSHYNFYIANRLCDLKNGDKYEYVSKEDFCKRLGIPPYERPNSFWTKNTENLRLRLLTETSVKARSKPRTFANFHSNTSQAVYNFRGNEDCISYSIDGCTHIEEISNDEFIKRVQELHPKIGFYTENCEELRDFKYVNDIEGCVCSDKKFIEYCSTCMNSAEWKVYTATEYGLEKTSEKVSKEEFIERLKFIYKIDDRKYTYEELTEALKDKSIRKAVKEYLDR